MKRKKPVAMLLRVLGSIAGGTRRRGADRSAVCLNPWLSGLEGRRQNGVLLFPG